MKQLLPFLLLLTLCASCATLDCQYAVVCDFPTLYQGKNWLIVTDNTGSILKIFDLPEGRSQFVDKFEYNDRDGLDTYNLHLVHRGDSLFSVSMVYSAHQVKNGEAVAFSATTLYTPSPAYIFKSVFIREIAAVYSIVIPGSYGQDFINYDASTRTAQN